MQSFRKLISIILRYSVFTSGAIGSSWAAICLFQTLLPRTFLATQRFFLGGFLGGLWAWAVRGDARAEILYSTRAAVESWWKIGKRRGWWKGIKGGDVAVFVLGLAILNASFERNRSHMDASLVAKALRSLRGEPLLRETPRENDDTELHYKSAENT